MWHHRLALKAHQCRLVGVTLFSFIPPSNSLISVAEGLFEMTLRPLRAPNLVSCVLLKQPTALATKFLFVDNAFDWVSYHQPWNWLCFFSGGHYQAGVVTTVALTLLLVLSCFVWFGYAYFFPHTWSGQLLIKYRPSHWQWRRAEPRYTAASIHM